LKPRPAVPLCPSLFSLPYGEDKRSLLFFFSRSLFLNPTSAVCFFFLKCRRKLPPSPSQDARNCLFPSERRRPPFPLFSVSFRRKEERSSFPLFVGHRSTSVTIGKVPSPLFSPGPGLNTLPSFPIKSALPPPSFPSLERVENLLQCPSSFGPGRAVLFFSFGEKPLSFSHEARPSVLSEIEKGTFFFPSVLPEKR